MSRPSILLFALALSACGAEPQAPETGAPPVMVVSATAHDVVDQVEATGQLLAQADATVASQVDGQVTGVRVAEGSAVGLGDEIIEIDPARRRLEVDDARAGVAQARAHLEEERRDATRVESLAKAGAASEARVDTARTESEMARTAHLAAEAKLGLAERALQDATVTAPFDGLVARRHVNIGEFVRSGDPLFHLVDLDPIEVEFFLSEADSSRASPGQTVEVRVASFPDEIFRAEVSVVSPTIEAETRTRRVKALLANPDGRLLPGTFARVDLGVAKRSGVVMVPKEALLLRSDGQVLFRLAENGESVARIRVEVGRHDGKLVEVTGIDAGDLIVARGQAGLVDGSPVSLRDTEGAPVSLRDLDALSDPGTNPVGVAVDPPPGEPGG
ncbi:MAG: efflux RND transporter periplasmic adaptor subunit [Myxococcales bacterium]|nr:efflux RND transporter periplasmic adaptor subunit [Myxococcales bacterium]